MRRVLIEAEKATRPLMQGTQRYVRGLLSALRSRVAGEDCEISVLIGGEIQRLEQLDLETAWNSVSENQASRNRSLGGAISRLGFLPGVTSARRTLGRRRISRRARRRWAAIEPFDLVHMTSPHSYRSLAGLRSKLVATVLDLTHRRMPEAHVRRNIKGTNEGLSFIARRASGVIAISESTRFDFLDYYEFPADRIRVVHLGLDHDLFNTTDNPGAESLICKRYGLKKPFVLALSTVEPRKNIDGLLDAWGRLKVARPALDFDLVLAGRVGWKAKETLKAMRAASEARVHSIGFVKDEHLPALMQAATCFCYLSHYEGFGLPLLEAMGCGAPVVFGNNSSMPEIAGDAGVGVNSRKPGEIAAALVRILEDGSMRAELSRRAIARAATFTWERTASETLAYYRELS